MPDDLATLGVLTLVGGAVAAIPVTMVAAWLWRWLARVPDGLGAGMAVGIGAWSLAMAAVTVQMLAWTQAQRQGVAVQGRLVGWEARSDTVRGHRQRLPSGTGNLPTATTLAPRVEWTDDTGRRHVVTALGGSLSTLQPGDVVPLRHPPGDPSAAVVDDVQNLMGATGLFFNLSVIGLLSSISLAWHAVADRRRHRMAERLQAGRRRGAPQVRAFDMVLPPGPLAQRFAVWRDRAGLRWHGPLWRAGMAHVAIATAGPLLLAAADVELLRVFALALASVALALLCFAAASALHRETTSLWLMLYDRLIGVLGFALFAAWLWGLGLDRA